MIEGILILSVFINISLGAMLFIARETANIDRDVIKSKNEAIEYLLEFIKDNELDLDNPYNEFLAYLDEEES